MSKKIEKRMYLEDLQRHKKGLLKGKVDWGNCVGLKIRFDYGNIHDVIEILNYDKDGDKKLTIQYKDRTKDISTGHFSDCRIGELLKIKTRDFKFEINQIIENKYNKNFKIVDRMYKNSNTLAGVKEKWYKLKCLDCGDEFWLQENVLTSRNASFNCPLCTNRKIIHGVNDIPTTDPWMIPFFQGGYDEAKNYHAKSHKKITPICPDCGRIKQEGTQIRKIFDTHSIACVCSDGKSYPEKYVYSLIEQLYDNSQISSFDKEVVYEWNKYKTFDGIEHQAYIDYIIVKDGITYSIEVDGEFHRKDNTMTNQVKEESEWIDKQRDINCLLNLKTETIRISNEGNLKDNINNSILAKLFDLSLIDWNKCEELGRSNLMKKVCDIKKENPNLTAVEIQKMLNNICSLPCVCTYLKTGSEFGWCTYDGINIIKKPIICLENGLVFESATYCEDNSVEIFGTRLWKSAISKRCIANDGKPHKGFTFKFIENLTKEENIKYNISEKLKELNITWINIAI